MSTQQNGNSAACVPRMEKTMATESSLTTFIVAVIDTLKPDECGIQKQIEDLRKAHPKISKEQLAEKWADKICWLYMAEGAASALPGVLPGIGTAAQICLEGSAIAADLAYMLRCMGNMVIGIAKIYERDSDAPFNQEFVRVLGLWCGVLSLGKEATVRITSKIAIAQFKRVPAEIFKKINTRVGITLLTKYGTKRGSIAVGRVIPFGVGSLVGGGFNLATMKGFKRTAIKYYKTDENVLSFDENT